LRAVVHACAKEKAGKHPNYLRYIVPSMKREGAHVIEGRVDTSNLQTAKARTDEGGKLNRVIMGLRLSM